jgi:hypothetical protein
LRAAPERSSPASVLVILREQTMQDILRDPVELIDEDLDEVAGGRVHINISHNFSGVGNNSTAIANNGNIVDAFNTPIVLV